MPTGRLAVPQPGQCAGRASSTLGGPSCNHRLTSTLDRTMRSSLRLFKRSGARRGPYVWRRRGPRHLFRRPALHRCPVLRDRFLARWGPAGVHARRCPSQHAGHDNITQRERKYDAARQLARALTTRTSQHAPRMRDAQRPPTSASPTVAQKLGLQDGEYRPVAESEASEPPELPQLRSAHRLRHQATQKARLACCQPVARACRACSCLSCDHPDPDWVDDSPAGRCRTDSWMNSIRSPCFYHPVVPTFSRNASSAPFATGRAETVIAFASAIVVVPNCQIVID